MNNYKSIAIDGPAGAGKSTISKELAKKLKYIYVDTGALYRAIALYMINNNIDFKDQDKVAQNLKNIDIKIKYKNFSQQVYLNNLDITDKIRTPEVSAVASAVSALKPVRDFLLDLQRDLAKNNNVIMDGRDIATVVLPNADIKFFLTANEKARATRRYAELIQTGKDNNISFEKVFDEMVKRDSNDSSREIAPLKKANDAILVDSSELSFEKTLEFILKIIKREFNI
ncbi:MAG: (d)CMP kinase [Oscillospiraceae bacterium]|nr:(d)CMP kinase [Oscillospiraceae bacterium]